MAAQTVITGASGLIGTWTLRHWSGAEPEAPSREHIDLLRPGGVEQLLSTAQPKVVVHLAWSASATAGYRDSDENGRWLDATLELAKLCVERDIALFCTGSAIDTSEQPDRYTRSKRDLRDALAADIRTEKVTWLRPHYVFDPVAGRPAVIAQAQSAAATGLPVALSTPTSKHDFVHASDVGNAVAHAVANRLKGVVEIGTGHTHAVSDLVEALGLAWVPGDPQPATSTPPARIDALLATGWSPAATEEFFANA